jgi:hypothetical protein
MKYPQTKIDDRIFADGEICIKKETTIIIKIEIYEMKAEYEIYVERPYNRVTKIIKKNPNDFGYVIYGDKIQRILTKEEIKQIKKALNWKIDDKYGIIL